jgi:hypothetical protein
MNINSKPRIFLYLTALVLLVSLLIWEFNYVRSYKDSGIMYFIPPTFFTWWVLLIGSLILTVPLVRKQPIGFFGLLLLSVVLIKPIFHSQLPTETAWEFYAARKETLKQLVKKYPDQPDRKITTPDIKDLDFEALLVVDGTHFFLVWEEAYEYPYGICYHQKGKLPSKILDRSIRYKKLEANWYEFE